MFNLIFHTHTCFTVQKKSGYLEKLGIKEAPPFPPSDSVGCWMLLVINLSPIHKALLLGGSPLALGLQKKIPWIAVYHPFPLWLNRSNTKPRFLGGYRISRGKGLPGDWHGKGLPGNWHGCWLNLYATKQIKFTHYFSSLAQVVLL